VVERAIFALGRGPTLPAVVFVQDEAVALAFQLGLIGLVLLQSLKVFEE